MNAIGPGPDESFSHCHVPADFDPDGQVALKSAVNRLIGARGTLIQARLTGPSGR